MNRNEIIRFIGAAAMFFGGYMGAQSLWWGWLTAIFGVAIMGLALWLQNRN